MTELENWWISNRFTIVPIRWSSCFRANDKVWLGLSLPADKDTEEDFMWLDGTPLQWTNWDDDDPNNMRVKKCVSLRMDKNKTYDTKNCNQEFSSLCEGMIEKNRDSFTHLCDWCFILHIGKVRTIMFRGNRNTYMIDGGRKPCRVGVWGWGWWGWVSWSSAADLPA